MSDRSTGWERFRRAYAARVWLRLLSMVVLFGAAILLLRVSGGFPPAAWNFLIQVIPLIPRLWHLRGTGILLPLGAVTALSASLAMAWLILLRMGWKIARFWKQDQRAHVSSSARVRLQVPQEQEAEASLSPLKARGDEHGSVTALQQERAGGNVVDTAASPSPTSVSSHSTSCRDAHESSTGQQIHEEADSGLKFGACIHLAPGQPWKEDAVFTSQGSLDVQSQTMPFGLFVVADGTGGHQLTGHDACQMAIGSVTSCIQLAFSETQMPTWSEQELMDVVIEGIQAANHALYSCNQENHAYMEASLVVCLVVDTVAYAASIGEIRVYLSRESSGLLKMIRGDVGSTEAQSMGERTEVDIDSFVMTLQQGDRLLFCTDGLWKFVRDPDFEGIMNIAVTDPSQTSNALIQTAIEGGSKDHIGVIVMQI